MKIPFQQLCYSKLCADFIKSIIYAVVIYFLFLRHGCFEISHNSCDWKSAFPLPHQACRFMSGHTLAFLFHFYMSQLHNTHMSFPTLFYMLSHAPGGLPKPIYPTPFKALLSILLYSLIISYSRKKVKWFLLISSVFQPLFFASAAVWVNFGGSWVRNCRFPDMSKVSGQNKKPLKLLHFNGL